MCCLAAKLIPSFYFVANIIFHTNIIRLQIQNKLYIFMYILDFLPDDPHQNGKDEQQHEKSPSVVTSIFLLS